MDRSAENRPQTVAAFVRDEYFAGCHDPDLIAKRYLDEALGSDDPEAMLLPAVRHAVGSQFSSIQAAVRGAAQSTDGRKTAHCAGGGPSRQSHNDGYIYNPDLREWIPLGQATIPDFEAAIAFHERMISAHTQTISEYRGYIKKIRQAGVTCLDEI